MLNLRTVQKSELVAFMEAVWVERPYCWRIASRVVRGYDVVDEVVQRAFLKMYMTALVNEAYRGMRGSSLRACLYAVVSHAAIDYLRSIKPLLVDDRDNWLYLSEASNYDDPETALMNAEDERDFERLLDRLTGTYRKVVEEVALRRKPYESVAQEEHCSVEAVRTRYHRAVQRMAKIVEEEHIVEGELRRWMEVYDGLVRNQLLE